MRAEGYDEGQKQLEQYNRYEDTLDVFLNIIIKRSPTMFVLINMTLMIWLVQTIFASNLQAIPRSIYYFSPLLEAKAIKNIYMTKDKNCAEPYQKITLKFLPTVKEEHLQNKYLTKWKEDDLIFCSKTFDQPFNFTRQCDNHQILCSGFCVKNKHQCPITDIKWIRQGKQIPSGYQQLYRFNNHDRYAIDRKNSSKFIVGIKAMYDKKCLNDVKIFDKYDNFTEYWKSTQDCGEEGSISSNIFRTFDAMDTAQFLEINGVMGPFIQQNLQGSITGLGYVQLLKFKSQSAKCRQANAKSKHLKDYMVQNPIAPSFTQSLLVVCFIFFTGCWAWLLGFYCFQGKRRQKNMIVILMSIIQLIVVAFTYSQNKKLFQTQHVVRQISECFQSPQVRDMIQWNFGITSASPFLIIIFLCTSFLSLQILCNFLDRCLYEPFYPHQEHYHSN